MTFGGAINSVRNSASGRRRFPAGERLVRGVGVPSAPGSPLATVTSPPPRQPRRPAHFTLRLCLLCLSLSNFSGWRTRGPPEKASCLGDGALGPSDTVTSLQAAAPYFITKWGQICTMAQPELRCPTQMLCVPPRPPGRGPPGAPWHTALPPRPGEPLRFKFVGIHATLRSASQGYAAPAGDQLLFAGGHVPFLSEGPALVLTRTKGPVWSWSRIRIKESVQLRFPCLACSHLWNSFCEEEQYFLKFINKSSMIFT